MGRVRWLALMVMAGCSFRGQASIDGGDVTPDTPIVFDDAGNQLGWLRRDTAAELGEVGSALADVAVDPRSPGAVLTPAAYHWGGVVARGYASSPFATKEAIDWATLEGMPVTGVAFVDVLSVRENRLPAGLRIALDNSWAYTIEGEIELPAGATQLSLDIDDFGAVEIAPPGTTDFVRVYTGQGGSQVNVNYPVTTAGWHPFRAIMCQTQGGGAYLTAMSPGLTNKRLRARVDALRGAAVIGWDDMLFVNRSAESLEPGALLANPLNGVDDLPPGATNMEANSARWYGQVLIDVPGAYTIRADTDDGHVLRVGDMTSNKLLIGASNVVSEITTTLRAGWNPIVLDYTQFGLEANARLEITNAPAGVTLGTIPPSNLRPVADSRARVITFDENPNLPIPNGAALDRTWTPDITGATVTDIWVSYRATHAMPNELEIRLFHPDGTSFLLRNSGPTTERKQVTTFTGKPVSGSWRFEARDTGGGMIGTLQGWTITVFTTGGPAPIAPTSRWISATHDIAATRLDVVTFAAQTAQGSTAQAWVRTCDVTPCTTEEWTGPYADGDAVTAPPRRYAQLRVDLTANGNDEAEVDWIELQYRFVPPP